MCVWRWPWRTEEVIGSPISVATGGYEPPNTGAEYQTQVSARAASTQSPWATSPASAPAPLLLCSQTFQRQAVLATWTASRACFFLPHFLLSSALFSYFLTNLETQVDSASFFLCYLVISSLVIPCEFGTSSSVLQEGWLGLRRRVCGCVGPLERIPFSLQCAPIHKHGWSLI